MSELPEGWGRTLHAPWTPEQVAVINRFQREAHIHPFTCGKCTPHSTLIATADGWMCPNNCGYAQDWVPAYMTDPVMLDRMTLKLPWPT
ncbi:uncharacterized protein RMCC_5860 [Mycolicibacterium canariasense]|uniref:Uncharacterized protein n=1 Tax=Mycolicibacterium canariasense TaxID=228230 RepID=A0A117IC23_MYCCR|nr:hypothetical protein [Mycolicibacterium canariasense]MCV7213143.1 hypothetical protein [Mycolicibacterium canariasense]GAS98895.1 uncharacterized protein RMCC_5860 [Mycolicibacterium canariasense]